MLMINTDLSFPHSVPSSQGISLLLASYSLLKVLIREDRVAMNIRKCARYNLTPNGKSTLIKYTG